MQVTTWILTKVIPYNQGKTALCQRQNYPIAHNYGVSALRNQFSS